VIGHFGACSGAGPPLTISLVTTGSSQGFVISGLTNIRTMVIPVDPCLAVFDSDAVDACRKITVTATFDTTGPAV